MSWSGEKHIGVTTATTLRPSQEAKQATGSDPDATQIPEVWSTDWITQNTPDNMRNFT